jgi:hypothetical protein
MAFDVSQLKAKPTVMPKRAGTHAKKDLGPNPWLDPAWPFNLKASYDSGEAYELVLAGKYEKSKYTRGKVKGEEYDKLTGDAADAVSLIRDAAEKLGLGVSIPVTPALIESGARKGQPRDGFFVVRYQAQKRKDYSKSKASKAAEATTPLEAPIPGAM